MTARLDAAVKALAREPFLRDLTHVEVKGPDGKWAWAGCVAKARVHPRGEAGVAEFAANLRLFAASVIDGPDEVEVRFLGGDKTIALPTAKALHPNPSAREVVAQTRDRIRRALKRTPPPRTPALRENLAADVVKAPEPAAGPPLMTAAEGDLPVILTPGERAYLAYTRGQCSYEDYIRLAEAGGG